MRVRLCRKQKVPAAGLEQAPVSVENNPIEYYTGKGWSPNEGDATPLKRDVAAKMLRVKSEDSDELTLETDDFKFWTEPVTSK